HIFAKKLLEKNKNTIICPLNDGDHKNGINSIQKIIHTIHQKHGAPYSGTLITTNNNISTIKMYDKHNDIESFITTCYTNYKKDNENQSYISILKRNLISYIDGMSG